MSSLYIQHIRKIFYLIVFAAGVWFVSFTIFPENQIVKLEISTNTSIDDVEIVENNTDELTLLI